MNKAGAIERIIEQYLEGERHKWLARHPAPITHIPVAQAANDGGPSAPLDKGAEDLPVFFQPDAKSCAKKARFLLKIANFRSLKKRQCYVLAACFLSEILDFLLWLFSVKSSTTPYLTKCLISATEYTQANFSASGV